jgi:DHA1 family tetracycline resistance protein-like MFS transporter
VGITHNPITLYPFKNYIIMWGQPTMSLVTLLLHTGLKLKPHLQTGCKKMNIRNRLAKPNSEPEKKSLLALAGIMALQMLSYTLIMPIFARRLGQFGAGVEVLSMMALAYSISNTACSPYLGALADRIGRRPLILGSLGAYAAAFIGYLFAPSPMIFVLIRALAGALTAGLAPAVLGAVADITPQDGQARWIGVVSGGGSFGWIIGPTLGGLCFDRWGYTFPFMISIGIALLAFSLAVVLVPETNPHVLKNASEVSTWSVGNQSGRPNQLLVQGLRNLLRSVSGLTPGLSVLLWISFTTIFAYAFIEPQLMIYVYDVLEWSSARFGMAVSGLGVALVFSQTVLGQLSDRFGRKPVLITGLLLSTAMYATVSISGSFRLIFLAYIVAGLGEGLIGPALSAFYLDLSQEGQKSRLLGLKAAAGAVGGAAGPGLVLVVKSFIPPQSIFLSVVVLLMGTALLALFVLQEPMEKAEMGSQVEKNPGGSQVLSMEQV